MWRWILRRALQLSARNLPATLLRANLNTLTTILSAHTTLMAQILKVQRLDPREESQNKDHGALKDFRVEDHNRPHQDTPRPKGEMMIPSTKRMPGQDGLLH